jgi:glyoxylase-like metal-dependent hydrolase (beta-lactamase superfamily II)
MRNADDFRLALAMTTNMRSDFRLPKKVGVIVRGWLNCNQILLADGDAHVLIDSGYYTHAQETLALLKANCAQVSRLINTYRHSDHIGGNAAVAERYGCPITVSALEAPNLEPWNDDALWMRYADQFAPRFRFTDTLSPGEAFNAADTQWQALAAPGHAMGALVFYSPEHRLLISGDALWRHGLGAIIPREGENLGLEAALATLDMIEKLGVTTVIPGHGEPFTEVAEAIAELAPACSHSRGRAQDARNFLKGMFVFSLLAKRSIGSDEALAYIKRVPVFGDLNRRFVRWPDDQMANMLLEELKQGGAIVEKDGVITPSMKA